MFAPTLAERASLDGVETDLVDQLRDGSLGFGVVARDRDTEPFRVAGETTVAQAYPHRDS
jgi:hypothetical protein